MKKKLVVFSGAGISAESGIKTFRDSDGMWEEFNVMEVATLSGWKINREKVLSFYNKRKNDLNTVQPNNAHKIIAELEQYYDVTVITQNVDDLHERAGTTNVIHLHGELNKMCSSKNKNLTLPYTEDIKIGDKHEDGSQLRPFIVWFGEPVPLFPLAKDIVETADYFVVIGTSLQVYPAASLLECVNDECKLYYIDKEPTIDALMFKADILQRMCYLPGLATEGVDMLKRKLLNN